jgi:CheY-like chemotaxis protein
MDINMPVMDGYEATKHIRAVPEFSDLPIVSLTGLGLPEEVAKMYAIGMNAHLTKPIQIGRLYTVFDRFVKPERKKTAARAPETEAASGMTYRDTEMLAAAAGLQRASGDEELYLEILDEFVKLYAAADDTLGLMMRTDDLEGAKKLCLDIKGVGASIGATRLAEVSGELHEALSRGEEKKLIALTERFGIILRKTMKEVRRYMP